MKVSYRTLLPGIPEPFVFGAPDRHELLGGMVIILALDEVSVRDCLKGFENRCVGIAFTLADDFRHSSWSPSFYHVEIEASQIDRLPRYVEMLCPMLERLSQCESEKIRCSSELKVRTEKLSQIRNSYEKTLERLGKMIDDARRQQARLSHIIEGTHVGTWEWNVQTDEVRLDGHWEDIIGYTTDEMIPCTMQVWKNITVPEDIPVAKDVLAKHFRGEIPYYECENRSVHKDGSIVWCLDRGKVLTWTADGKPLTMYGTRQDISDRKNYEQAIAQMYEQLQSKNSELQQLLYVASHDLRAPLINVTGFSLELRANLDEIRHLDANATLVNDMDLNLQYIEKSVEKMEALLGGLLKLSRMGRETLRVMPLSVRSIVEKVVAVNEFLIRESNAQIKILDMPPCMGDEAALNQVFANLLQNALKYRHPDRIPEIQFSGENDENRIVYCIADNGLGIDAAHHHSVFEIFHRVHKDIADGEGLGLAIVRQNVTRMGGTVWLESQPGLGSRFYLAMPPSIDSGM